jgi:hypothetical protein
MFGREAKIGINLVSNTDEKGFDVPVAEYISLMKERMRTAYALVCEGLKTSFGKAKRKYEGRVKFEVGQKVWYFCPRGRQGYPTNGAFRRLGHT